MTAPLLSVGRLNARYVIAPGAAEGTPERLDAIVRRALEGPLETALGGLALAPGEEICIDAMRIRVHVPLGATDAAASATWSATTAAAIAHAIAAGGRGVVRYSSRSQALADVARGIALGDLSRAWAWRKLDLWRASEVPDWTHAAVELVHALRRERAAVAPLIAELARTGLLPAFGKRAGADAIVALAGVALQAAGAQMRAVVAGDAETYELGVRGEDGSSARIAIDGVAERIVRASAIAEQARAVGGDPVVCRALAALAVLESEPSALQTTEASAYALITAVAERVVDSGGGDAAGEDERAGRRRQSTPHVDATAEGSGRQAGDRRAPDLADPVNAGDGAPACDGSVEPHSRGEPTDPTADSGHRTPDTERHAADEQTGPDAMSEPDAGDDRDGGRGAAATPPEIARSAAETALAGLLFLIHVVGDLDVATELAGVPELAARSPRWSVHRLGMALAGAKPDDPAALAFAGVAPDAPPPGAADPGPNRDELDAIAAAAARVVCRLRELLDRPDEPGAELLAFVCARRAEIVSDPGWIEAHMPLEGVSPELRCAGLDFDPGWVPWLGTLVRIVYG